MSLCNVKMAILQPIQVRYQRAHYCNIHSNNQTQSFFIDRVALAKQGDNALGSVRPSVCPSVRLWICVSVFPSSHGLTV